MDNEDREFLSEKIERRVEWMLERIGQPSPAIPWLPSGSSYSSLRRTAARLRAGVIRPLDPRISPIVLAEMIEKAIEQELLAKSAAVERRQSEKSSRSRAEKSEAERKRRLAARLHRLKKSPEASDPESPVAQEIRSLHRELRSEFGRPRGRRE